MSTPSPGFVTTRSASLRPVTTQGLSSTLSLSMVTLWRRAQ